MSLNMQDPAPPHGQQEVHTRQAPELGNSDLPLHGPRRFTSGEDGRDKFWSAYLEEAIEHDKKIAKKYKTDIDIVVFFSGLFAAVVASFLAATQPALSPDPRNTTNALLMILIHNIDNSTFPDQPLTIPQWSGPPHSVVHSQVLGYLSLSLTLFAALGAMVGKQWLSHFGQRSILGTNEVRGQRQLERLAALDAWLFHIFMKVLPALIQVALGFFAIALCTYLWEINRTVAVAVIWATTFIGLVYTGLTVASLWFPSCPYETPFTSIIRWMIATAIASSRELRAWHRDSEHRYSRRTVRSLSRLLPLLLFPVFGWGTIVLTILLTIAQAAASRLLIPSTRYAFHSLLSRLKLEDIMFRQRRSLSSQCLDISWGVMILELSTRQDVITAATEQLLETAVKPYGVGGSHSTRDDVLEARRLTRRLYHLFLDSGRQVHWQSSTNQRDHAVVFGKALACVVRFGWNFEPGNTRRYASPCWDGARLSIEELIENHGGLDPEVNYLLHLVDAFIPVTDNSQGTSHLAPFDINSIPYESTLWSLSLFRRIPPQQLPLNQRLMDVISASLPVLEYVCFSDGRKWSALELSSYLRASQAYLQILYQQSLAENNAENYQACHPINLNWKIIRQLLSNLHDADESLWMREDGCFLDTLDRLSELLRIDPSWPDDIQASVHDVAFRIYFGARALPMQVQLHRLMHSTFRLAAIGPPPKNHFDPKINQTLSFLLDRLVNVENCSGGDEEMYILTIIQGCSAKVNRSVWLDENVATYLLNPTRPSDVQRISLDILSAACESGPPDDVLRPLVCQDNFRDYIRRGIASQSYSPRHRSGLRILDIVLPYLPHDKTLRARWRERLGREVALTQECDALSLEDSFRLVRIKCALYPGLCSGELSAYWRRWTEEQAALEVARVVPVAYWVRTHCEPSPPQAWYTELRDGFDGLLRVAWGGGFEGNLVVLRELASCTEEWLEQRVDRSDSRDATVAAVRAAACRMLEKYELGEEDICTLQRFKDL